ncbi:MAG: ABC transporter substrate-binding protein [Pseudomonadota bacterium]
MGIRSRWMAATLLWLLLAPGAGAASRPSVVFLAPDDSTFWTMVAGVMQEAAIDLDMDLEVVFDRGRDRFTYLRLAEKVLERDVRPDYLMFMAKENVTAEMLTLASKADVKVFTFNTDIPARARETVGMPRKSLPNWIGHLVPDNVAAGRQLAAALAAQAAELGLTRQDSAPDTIALSGTRDSSAAKDRNLGLMQAAQDRHIALRQLIFADWSREQAGERTRVLLQRYPEVTMVWSASDGMAVGAIAAAKAVGREPGKNVVIGGFDWEPEALEAIRRGELTLSLGRHFLGGALGLLQLYDYHAGMDFAQGASTAALKYRLEAATQSNVDRIERVMDPESWQRVDFRQFSRALNKDLADQSPNADQQMDALVSALAQTKAAATR